MYTRFVYTYIGIFLFRMYKISVQPQKIWKSEIQILHLKNISRFSLSLSIYI